jgi:hypothetical protein
MTNTNPLLNGEKIKAMLAMLRPLTAEQLQAFQQSLERNRLDHTTAIKYYLSTRGKS